MEAKYSEGNYVEHNGVVWTVYSIIGAEPRKDERFDNKKVLTLWNGGLINVPVDEVSPIELSEDWLIRMGYSKCPHALNHYRIKGHVIWKLEGFYFCDKNGIKLNTVHQLQNLYYSLTSSELTIKDINNIEVK